MTSRLNPITPDTATFLLGVRGIVEASNAEQHFLWRLNEQRDPVALPWISLNEGRGTCVGFMDETLDKPIWISLNVAFIDGFKIAFYHDTSVWVDHEVISQWIRTQIPGLVIEGRFNHADAMNFHNIFHPLWREMKAAKRVA